MNFLNFKDRLEKVEVKEFFTNKTEKPLVSICVQTYQHKDFIKNCLEGILMQKTKFPIEILLGDDESSDGTREICVEYANKFPNLIRLFLHHRENNILLNGKPSGRFNFSYNLYSARGKYIAICEGDDYWTDPEKLQKQVNFLEENPTFSLCFHNVNIINTRKKNDQVYPMHRCLEKNIFTTQDLLRPCFIHTASLCFRKKEGFNLPDWFFQVESGDIALMLLISLEGEFKYFDKIMSVYRKHDAGISTSHTGYSKAFAMVYLYHLFNTHTGGLYYAKLNEAMRREIYGHLPEFHELRRLRRENKTKFIGLFQNGLKKIYKILKVS